MKQRPTWIDAETFAVTDSPEWHKLLLLLHCPSYKLRPTIGGHALMVRYDGRMETALLAMVELLEGLHTGHKCAIIEKEEDDGNRIPEPN